MLGIKYLLLILFLLISKIIFAENESHKIEFKLNNRSSAIVDLSLGLLCQYIHIDPHNAYAFFYRSQWKMEKANMQNTHYYNIADVEMANIEYKFGLKKKALNRYLNWYLFHDEKQIFLYSTLNTFGRLLSDMGFFEYSIPIFLKAYNEAGRKGLEEMQFIILGNIANSLFHLNKYDQSEKLFHIDYKNSIRLRNFTSAGNVLFFKMRILKKKNLNNNISTLFYKADSLYELSRDLPPKEFYRFSYLHFINLNEKELAYKCLQKSIEIDSLYLLHWDDAKFNRVQLLALQEKLIQEKINDSKIIKKKRNALYYSLFTAAFIIYISVIVSIKLKKKYRESQKRNQLIKQTINEELTQFYDKNIPYHGLKVDQEHEIPVIIQRILHDYNKSLQVNNIQSEEFINELSNIRILTEEDWSNFKQIFQAIYPYFIDNLTLKLPSITQGELRLCCLIRLNKNPKEISEILGISIESVRKSQRRFRSKINLSQHTELINYIFSIKAQ